jgi:YD repeat-containing protein
MTFLGPDSQPIINEKRGFAKSTAAYDPRGNNTEEAFFDPDGQPMLSAQHGYAKRTRTYGSRDQITAEAYFGPDGQLLLHAKEGYAKMTRTYNDQGWVMEQTYRGPDDRPMLRKNRYARVTFRYDGAGRRLEATLWDLEGKKLPPAEVTIIKVYPDSQAAQLGLRKGDVIVRYDGKALPNSFSLDTKARATDEGRRSLQIRRGDQEHHFMVDPGGLGVDLEDVWPGGSLQAKD